MRLPLRWASCIVITVLGCGVVRAGDWPRFHGPNGAGAGEAKGLPVEFGPAKNLAWKVPVQPGHSSPVVVGNRIYLTAAGDKELLTLAYDLATGRQLWRRSLARERAGRLQKPNSAAAPTPAADGAGVVVFFQDFGLAAYSSDGKPVWTLPVKPMVNVNGMACSPIVAGETVVQVLGCDRESKVVAVSRSGGELRWEQPLKYVTFSTPVGARGAAGESLVVVVSSGEAVAFRASDGRRTWWLNRVPYQAIASPVASPDGTIVYVAVAAVNEAARKKYGDFDQLLKAWDVNGDGKITGPEFDERNDAELKGSLAQFDLNGDGIYDRAEHEQLWKLDHPHLLAAVPAAGQGDMAEKLTWVQQRRAPYVPSPLLYDGVFYVIRTGGITASLDPARGTLWKEGRIAAGFGTVYASPVAADGKIYAANLDGTVAVLKAGREWEVLAMNELGEQCFATPAICGDRIIVRTTGHLWCFRAGN